MTREEALDILTHNWTRLENPNYDESELDKAYYMAIEALQTDAVSREDTVTLNSPISIQAEMVAVVRCKDCRHYLIDDLTATTGWCFEIKNSVNEDDFCSYGERREP